jgi:hypothetical protein
MQFYLLELIAVGQILMRKNNAKSLFRLTNGDPNSTISKDVALLPLQQTEQQSVSNINNILTK